MLRLLEEEVATQRYGLLEKLAALFQSWQYDAQLKGQWILVADGDLAVDGHLHLDYADDAWHSDATAWRKALRIADDDTPGTSRRVCGLVVTGNLTVNGNVINANMNEGPFLLVMGSLKAYNLVSGGGTKRIMGDADIRGVAYGHYNDGQIAIDGNLRAPVFINDDHAFGYGRLTENVVNLDSHGTSWLDSDDDDELVFPETLAALLSADVLRFEDIVNTLARGGEALRQYSGAAQPKDRVYWLARVREDHGVLPRVPKEERDAELYAEAVRANVYAFQNVPQAFRSRELCEDVVRRWPEALEYVPEDLKTKAMCELAIELGANLRYVPTHLIDVAMAERAVAANSDSFEHVPRDLATATMCESYLRGTGSRGYRLQAYFQTPRPFALEDVVLKVASTSLDALDALPGMYVTPRVFAHAQSLYATHPQWAAVCKRHGREAAMRQVDDALLHAWMCFIDEAFVLDVLSRDVHAASYIAHGLMTPAVVRAMLAGSTTHVQYLPDHLLTDELAEAVIRDWFTNLGCLPLHRRTPKLCKLALELSHARNDYLLDEVIDAIPEALRGTLGVRRDS